MCVFKSLTSKRKNSCLIISTMFRNRLLFLFILCVTAMSSFCQSSADSLVKYSKNQLEQRYAKHKNSLPEIAEVYADRLYSIAEEQQDAHGQSKALYKRAYIESRLGNNNSALQLLDESLQIAKAISNDSLLLKNAIFI